MFIKKDLRKIPRILHDAIDVDVEPDDYDSATEDASALSSADRDAKRVKRTEALRELKLARRQQEFQGSVQILCQPDYLPKLTLLESLNLYDCGIASLDGIGILKDCPKLEVVNLGRNPIQELPEEFGRLNSIKELWLDDCQNLSGPMPQCLGELSNLQTLRASKCGFTELPESVVQGWPDLEILCLDRNQLTHLPPGISKLPNLQQLLLRHNPIETVPDDLLATMPLKLLHLSSTKITALPSSIAQCTTLTHVWINQCQITNLPEGLENLIELERLVLSHNPLETIPESFWKFFGQPNLETGICEVSTTCQVLLQGTPVLENLKQQQQPAEEKDASLNNDDSMEVENE